MTKVYELQEAERLAWVADYPRRDEKRIQLGRQAIAEYRTAFARPAGLSEMAESAVDAALIRRGVLSESLIKMGLADILITEFKRAAMASRGERGENLDVSVNVVTPEEIDSPAPVEKWGNHFRIHPAARAAYVDEIFEGRRTMLLARQDGEPAAQVSVIWDGPIVRPTEIPAEKEKEFTHLPAEDEVVWQLGGPKPWVEHLAVNEGYRGGGIGQRMMLEVEEVVNGHPEAPQMVALSVRPDNVVAIDMYRNLGYSFYQVAGSDSYVSHAGGQAHPVRLMVKKLE